MSLDERELSAEEFADLLWREERRHVGRGMSAQEFDESRRDWQKREREREDRADAWLHALAQANGWDK